MPRDSDKNKPNTVNAGKAGSGVDSHPKEADKEGKKVAKSPAKRAVGGTKSRSRSNTDPTACSRSSSSSVMSGSVRSRSTTENCSKVTIDKAAISLHEEILDRVIGKLLTYVRDKGIMITFNDDDFLKPFDSRIRELPDEVTFQGLEVEAQLLASLTRKIGRKEKEWSSPFTQTMVGMEILRVAFDLKTLHQEGNKIFFAQTIEDIADNYLGALRYKPVQIRVKSEDGTERVLDAMDALDELAGNLLDNGRFDPTPTQTYARRVLARLELQEAYFFGRFPDKVAEANKRSAELMSNGKDLFGEATSELGALLKAFNGKKLMKTRGELDEFLQALMPFNQYLKMFFKQMLKDFKPFKKQDCEQLISLSRAYIDEIDYFLVALIWSRFVEDEESSPAKFMRHLDKLKGHRNDPPITLAEDEPSDDGESVLSSSPTSQANFFLKGMYNTFSPDLTEHTALVERLVHRVRRPDELLLKFNGAANDTKYKGKSSLMSFGNNPSMNTQSLLKSVVCELASCMGAFSKVVDAVEAASMDLTCPS